MLAISTMEPLTTTLSAVGRDLLKTAHAQKDIYFSGFLHNHLSHGLLSLTSFTKVSDEELEAHYQAHVQMLQARPEPLERVGRVTVDNWHTCLDTAGVKASGNFLDFFDETLGASRQDFADALITYVLDPHIVSRLIGGAIHPLIHLGYACELYTNEPETARLLLSEALAMQCTTRNQFKAAIESLQPLEQVNKAESELQNSCENRVLQVLDIMSHDAALANVPASDNPDKCDYTISRIDVMSKYYNMFPVTNVQTAFEELFFGALAILFGTISRTKAPRLDFFLAHCLTSAVSLRQVLPLIEDTEVAAMLCRYHFVAMLAWHRARGHPCIDLQHLMTQPTDLEWEECESRLRADPGLEVHSLKVFRALEMGKTEPWTRDAMRRGVLPGVNGKIWLICANVLVRQIRNGRFTWLHGDQAWEYYNS